jgi:hypothetical protein
MKKTRLILLYLNRSLSLSVWVHIKSMDGEMTRLVIHQYGRPDRIVAGTKALHILCAIKDKRGEQNEKDIAT